MSKPLPSREYIIIAIDPEADWRCVHTSVRAVSRSDARHVARRVLRAEKREHWDIELVVEADGAQ